MVFPSTCRLEDGGEGGGDGMSAAGGPFVYHLAWKSRRDPQSTVARPRRLPHCAGCAGSYGAMLRRLTVTYWSGDGAAAAAEGDGGPGAAVASPPVHQELRLRWVTFRGRERSTELCRRPVGAGNGLLPAVSAVDGRSALYVGTFNPTGNNPAASPELFLTDIANRPGATRQLTTDGVLPGGPVSASERYVAFAALDDHGAPALFRIKFR